MYTLCINKITYLPSVASTNVAFKPSSFRQYCIRLRLSILRAKLITKTLSKPILFKGTGCKSRFDKLLDICNGSLSTEKYTNI